MNRVRRVTSRGFTLIELTVSLGITTVLLLAMGSVMVLASRAVPEKNNRAARAIEAVRALEVIADDLAYAESIREGSGTSFTVADRTGDEVPETCTFGIASGSKALAASWSGSSTRAITLLGSVSAFEVSVEREGDAAVAVELVLTLSDLPDEPFRRRVALLNRPGS